MLPWVCPRAEGLPSEPSPGVPRTFILCTSSSHSARPCPHDTGSPLEPPPPSGSAHPRGLKPPRLVPHFLLFLWQSQANLVLT